MSECDHRARDRGIGRIRVDVAHEGLVDLQSRYRKPLQVAQARIPGSEIVYRQTHTERSQRAENADRCIGVARQQALRQLEVEPSRRQPSVAQCRPDDWSETLLQLLT